MHVCVWTKSQSCILDPWRWPPGPRAVWVEGAVKGTPQEAPPMSIRVHLHSLSASAGAGASRGPPGFCPSISGTGREAPRPALLPHRCHLKEVAAFKSFLLLSAYHGCPLSLRAYHSSQLGQVPFGSSSLGITLNAEIQPCGSAPGVLGVWPCELDFDGEAWSLCNLMLDV